MNLVKGLYGKLPSHGDFVSRDLPPAFINIWDEWLQRGLLSSQETLGDNWLEFYLTSPVWRFALSSGSVDQSSWAGVMIPSVDRVGRYYPFTLLSKMNADTVCFDVISSATDWFIQLENLALEGLDGHLNVEDLYYEMQKIPSLNVMKYRRSKSTNSVNSVNTAFVLTHEEEAPSSVYGSLLDQIYRKDSQSYSLWHCQGSQYVNPSLLVAKGLPPSRCFTALIDGKWEAHNWLMPVPSLVNTNVEYDSEETA